MNHPPCKPVSRKMLSGDNIVKGNAVVNQVASIASLITPFLGSVFYTAFGIRPVFYAAVVCFFVTCFAGMLYSGWITKSPNKKWGLAQSSKKISLSVCTFCAGTARYYETSSAGSGREPVCSGHCCGRLSLFGTYRVGTFSNPLWHCGKCNRCCVYFGSLCVVVLAKKLRVRHLATVLVSFGICLIPCGIAFLLPVSAFTRYLILLVMFCACQLGCSLFSPMPFPFYRNGRRII